MLIARALRGPRRAFLVALQLSRSATCLMTTASSHSGGDLYRRDGVRIAHDPFAPGMAEKYGTPGATDREGFDPYADSVGAGIYGGIVQRHPDSGEVVIGRQVRAGQAFKCPRMNARVAFDRDLNGRGLGQGRVHGGRARGQGRGRARPAKGASTVLWAVVADEAVAKGASMTGCSRIYTSSVYLAVHC